MGRLIWALAYEKAHNPEVFWQAALKHCRGSYRRWVYQREGILAGALPVGTDLIDEVDEFKRLGYWTSPNFLPGTFAKRDRGKAAFCGVVANSRVFKNGPKSYITFLTLGIGNGKYIDVTLPRAQGTKLSPIVLGHGFLKMNNRTEFIDVKQFKPLAVDKLRTM